MPQARLIICIHTRTYVNKLHYWPNMQPSLQHLSLFLISVKYNTALTKRFFWTKYVFLLQSAHFFLCLMRGLSEPSVKLAAFTVHFLKVPLNATHRETCVDKWTSSPSFGLHSLLINKGSLKWVWNESYPTIINHRSIQQNIYTLALLNLIFPTTSRGIQSERHISN